MGTKDELGKLSLGENENFCMGGPGIILSRETLSRFTPHIKDCLKNFYTYHEDVELGRCVHKYANTSCTWSYEMQHILYNHPNKTAGYQARNLVSTDILRAASLHSIKDIRVFARVHNFALQRRMIELEQRTMLLRRQSALFGQILAIDSQLEAQRADASKFAHKAKSPAKQVYELLSKPDERIAEQIMAMYNNTHGLFNIDNNRSRTLGRTPAMRRSPFAPAL